MKAVNVDEVLKILHKYGEYTFVTDNKKYSDMVNEIANLKDVEQEPCEDCISRQAVIKHICEYKECYKDECKGRLYKRCWDIQWVYDLPSVIPKGVTITDFADKCRECGRQKKGKWIIGKYKDTCSHCRCTYPKNIGFKNYCPYCGTKMAESEEA